MQIKKIKINQFGKLENKQIDLNKINLIYGKNESGKSTLLDFITSMFYGISKNKNSKTMSDYDKYKPWNEKEFSGNLTYTLNNGEEINIFRKFDKKTAEITNSQGVDISKQFEIDKTKGNQFFIEQTGIDRELISSTVITSQKETELNQNTQNNLLQKIANLSESGEEEISYKTAIAKLDKLLLEEIGTSKSQERPINITQRNIQNLTNQIQEIKQYEQFKQQYQTKNKEIELKLEEEKQSQKLYDEIYQNIKQENLENEKIKIKEKLILENNEKIEKIEKQGKTSSKPKNKKTDFIIFLILFLVILINLIFFRNKITNIFNILIIFIFLFYLIFKKIIENKKIEKNNKNNEIELLQRNNKELSNEVTTLKNEIIKNNEKIKNNLQEKYKKNINELYTPQIDEKIKINEEQIKKLELEKYKLELDNKNIQPKLEKLSEIEEQLQQEKTKYNELIEKSKIYEITKELMQESYEEMKKNVTPKFNQNLSSNIEKFSNGKYKTISINDGIRIQLSNGEYKPIESFSTGTIEQIYLALRLSVVNQLSKETLPIILDESFAYFDDERMSETLNYLCNEPNQLIILTCTNREKSILDKNNVNYNYIEL